MVLAVVLLGLVIYKKTFFPFVEAKNATIVQKDATYQRVNTPFNSQLDSNQKLIKK